MILRGVAFLLWQGFMCHATHWLQYVGVTFLLMEGVSFSVWN